MPCILYACHVKCGTLRVAAEDGGAGNVQFAPIPGPAYVSGFRSGHGVPELNTPKFAAPAGAVANIGPIPGAHSTACDRFEMRGAARALVLLILVLLIHAEEAASPLTMSRANAAFIVWCPEDPVGMHFLPGFCTARLSSSFILNVWMASGCANSNFPQCCMA